MPAWAWVVAIGGGLVFAMMLRRRRAASADEVEAENIDESDVLAAGDTSGLGKSFPSGGPAAPAVERVPEMIPSDYLPFPSSGVGNATEDPVIRIDPIVIEFAVADSLPTNDTAMGRQTPTSGPAPATRVPPSFEWGGRKWYRGNKPEFIRHLNSRGSDYWTWVERHPKAALEIFGDRPRPTPAPAPQPKPRQLNTGGGPPNRSVASHAPPERPDTGNPNAARKAISGAAKPKSKPTEPAKKKKPLVVLGRNQRG